MLLDELNMANSDRLLDFRYRRTLYPMDSGVITYHCNPDQGTGHSGEKMRDSCGKEKPNWLSASPRKASILFAAAFLNRT